MVTHPDADHIQGILKLFERFPPNQDPVHGNAKFKFKGPLLLTKFFESNSFHRIMSVIKDAKFQKQNIDSGDRIDGFEKNFTFVYPVDDYPGTLYTYQPPPSFFSVSFAMLASARYSPSTSNPNLSSTILVVNDPNSTNPLVSLNGDAIGHSIIQSLNGKHPKVFKVSHHGSIHNSIELKEYVPNGLESTQKLLATLMLLQFALKKYDYTFFNEQITSRSLATFFKKFTERPSHTMQLRRKRFRPNPIYFNDELANLAKKFNNALKNQGINSEGHLQKLIRLTNAIDKNSKNPNVNSVDLYTHNIPDKNELDDFVKKHYDNIKNETLSATTPTEREALKEIYSMLETDRAFSGKVAFTLSRAFYLKINAQTYFISSGSFHDHPNWEVINGIIAAAHDKHQKDTKYKCRLLLTSGNNIKADKLGELALTDDWKQYVSLQYFASNTASVEIDPDETNPLTVLPGTVEWQGALSEQKQNELLDGYNKAKGAQELKVARSASSGQYEINPFTDKNSWLAWQSSSKGYELALSSQRAVIAVESVSIIFPAKSIQNIVTEFAFRYPPFSVNVYGLLGVHTPSSQLITYLLYTLSNDNKEMYFTIKNGALSTSDKKEDATHFQFTSVPVSTVTFSHMLLSVRAPRVMKKVNVDSTNLPLMNAAVLDEGNEFMTLEQFLQLVQYSGDTIACKELLHILVSQQFTSQLLTEHSSSIIGDFIAGIFTFIVDASSTFLVQDSEVISADVKLKLFTTPLMLHNYPITGVNFAVSSPKTVNQMVTLQLDTTDNEIPVTLTYHLKSETYVRNFQKYLISLGITKTVSTFKIFDAVILLLQSETSGFVYLSSLSRKMLGDILEWSINEEASSVEFVKFPTGPVVISACIVAEIPDDCPPLDLGWKGPLKINKIGFMLPNQVEFVDSMYLFANATIGGVDLQLKAFTPNVGMLPTFEVSLTKPLSLSDLTNLLQVSSGISDFSIPLTSNILKNVQIINTSVTYQQGIQGTQQVYLSKLALGIKFENLAKYLPSSFSSLQSVSASVAIYQPNISPVQVAMEINFEFHVTVSVGKNILLNASFATEPVLAGSKAVASYNFTISVQAKSDVIGTTEGGISLNDFLQVFELSAALQAAHRIPILSSILANIELKQLVLAMNTNSKEMNEFVLELIIFNWIIIPEKVIIEEASIIMSYIDSSWASKFDTTVTFNNQYSVNAHFELSDSSKFSFGNPNSDFTIAKFLDVFGLGNLNSLPVVGQLLNVTVKEASLEMMKGNVGEVKITGGRVSIYTEVIEIGSLFKLSQVNATIGFIFDPSKQGYVFGFSIRGFINEKVYLDVEYDYYTSILSGQVAISTSSTENFSEVLTALNKNGIDIVDKNVVFQNISESSTLGITIAMKFVSGNFMLTDLVISLNKEILIGPIALQRLQFEYHHKSDGDAQSQDVYKLVGRLVNNEKQYLGGILEFDLSRDTTGESSVTASLSPIQGSSLSLKSFLAVLGIASPPLPEIEGQTLPKFFDIALTKGTISVSVPSFQILAFSLEVSTVNEVVILDSPLLKLEKLSLQVDYDVNPKPFTKAFLLGEFTIGNVQFKLSGSREEEGTIFSLDADWSHNSIDVQQAFNKLTPDGSDTPVIPTDIGIPENFKVLAVRLDIKLLYASKMKSLDFRGESSNTWPIDIGFQQFTVEELGGMVSYLKSTDKDTSEFKVNVIGKFQFSNSILMACELSFGTKGDTVLSALTAEIGNVNVSSVADDVLGFNHSKEPNSDGIKFLSLLPNSVQPINYSKFFVNMNFTQSIFLCFGELVTIGHGLLIAGNFSTDSKQYGYVFGISLPLGFKFSNLIPALSIIDEILTLNKVNCMIVSVQNIKAEDVLVKLKAAEESAIFSTDYKSTFPFKDLSLDAFTTSQVLGPGLSIYGELIFQTTKLGSLFNSIIQITDAKSVPNIIVSSFISTDPSKSEFKAYIAKLILLGTIQFSAITFSYKPANKAMFKLMGTISVMLGEQNYNFVGKFSCNNACSEFTVSTDHALKIAEPLGMFGITLNDAHLQMIYNYPQEEPHTSSQTILANVSFYSKDKSSSSEEPPTPSIVLECSILFDNYCPIVVKITLQPTAPLTIADFVQTVFGWDFDVHKYLNIGFVNGQVYFAKVKEGTKSITIDGATYKTGYHISADIEVFNELFTINADISSSEVRISGYANTPLDLGFAKFTGVDDSDPSKPDISKSPELLFITNSSSTSISMDIGFVLFDVPLGAAQLGYKLKSNDRKVFFGQIAYNGSIGFIKNPSMEFEWSKEYGFKVTNWPVVGSFKDAFDFFAVLRNYKDDCGALVDLSFKEGVQTQFNINVNLSKSEQPEKFLADIDITGTYDVLLLKEVKIASVPIPNISVGIPKEDNFMLGKLPKFILDLFAKNSDRIIQQITNYPDRLAKILAISLLKKVTKEVIGTLVCRNVDAQDLDPSDGGDDVTDDDFSEADNAESEFNEAVDTFESALEDGSLSAAGTAAAGASAEGITAVGLFAGIITAIGSILGFFGIGSYKEKKKKAEERKKQIENRLNEINEKMRNALDIRQNPLATFTPPDKLTASWNAIKDDGVKYHVHLEGTLLTSEMQNNLGQVNTSPITLYDKIVSDVHLNHQNENLYNVVGLRLSVNGTLIVNKDHTYNGDVYTVDVPNVHPTLHPPSNIRAIYHHSSLQIGVVAEPVQHAEKYYFELIDSKNLSLAQCMVTSSSISNEIQCSFSHSVINLSSSSVFKVRGQSVAKSGSNIASSAYSFSNELLTVEPVINLRLIIPHFSNRSAKLELNWELPDSVDKTVAFLCQVVLRKSGKVLVSKEVHPSTATAPLPTKCSIEIVDVITAIAKVPLLNDPINLVLQVSASSNSETIMDSKFIGQLVTSLPSPQNVTCNFSDVKNTLGISWIYMQATQKYGIKIKGLNSAIVFSKLVEVRRDPDIEPGKVGVNIPHAELQTIDDPSVQYNVEVTSVADGNDTMDSLVPGKAEKVLQVLHAPAANTLEYTPSDDHESVVMTFEVVDNTSTYLTNLFSIENSVASDTVTSGEQPTATSAIFVDKFIDKVSSGDKVTGSVQSLGKGYFLSSKSTKFTQHLEVLSQPSTVEYSYSPEQDTITLTCSPIDEDGYSYKLGFVGYSKDGAESSIAKLAVKNPEGKLASIFVVKNLSSSGIDLWKGFAQTTLTNQSTTELPSPRLFLKDNVHILSTTTIKSVQLNSSFTVLTIIFPSVQNANSYKIQCDVKSNDTILKHISKEFPSTNNEALSAEIILSQEIPEWNLIFLKVTTISVTVTAVGSGYYITSDPSEPKQIKKQQSPTNLTYSYSNTDDVITITCQNSQGGNTEVTLGLLDAESSANRISATTSTVDDDKYQIKLAGQKVRDVNKPNQHWLVFAESLGNNVSLPSGVVTLPDHVKVLPIPKITSATYDESATSFSVNWSNEPEATAYKVSISYETKDQINGVVTKETQSTSLIIDMKKQVSHWESIFNSVKSIIVTVRSLGTSMYINSPGNDLKIVRTTPPSGISFSSTDTGMTVSWNTGGPDVTYNISVDGDYGQVKRSVENVTSCTLQKRSILYPSTSPYAKTIEVNMTSVKKDQLPSTVISKQTSIKTQLIAESKLFGTPSGKYFDDSAGQPAIVGMKSLVIHHESSIHSLQASYYLANGSVYTGPIHGGQTGNQSVLTFNKQESIIAISALSSNTTKLSQLIVIIQHADGSYKRYGPYGSAVSSNPEQQVKFSGNVLAIRGNCDDNFINAVGFTFTYAHPILLASNQFGGEGGSPFDEHTLTHIPRVVGIKSINVTYKSNHVTTIQLTYLTQDGKIWEAPMHGGKKHFNADLQFEDGEAVIQVSGNTYFDQQLQKPSNIVKQLSFKTQKKDGSTNIYGPYPGRVGGSDNHSFVINGALLGLYGRSGWFLDSLGFYYTLQRTELLGGSGGSEFDVENITNIAGIKILKVQSSSSRIESIEVTYFDAMRRPLKAVKHGRCTNEANVNSLEFEEGEEVIETKLSTYKDTTLQTPNYIIRSLQFITQKEDGSKKKYGPYGGSATEEHTFNGRVVAFFGRSGWFLDALGLYYIPF